MKSIWIKTNFNVKFYPNAQVSQLRINSSCFLCFSRNTFPNYPEHIPQLHVGGPRGETLNTWMPINIVGNGSNVFQCRLSIPQLGSPTGPTFGQGTNQSAKNTHTERADKPIAFLMGIFLAPRSAQEMTQWFTVSSIYSRWENSLGPFSRWNTEFFNYLLVVLTSINNWISRFLVVKHGWTSHFLLVVQSPSGMHMANLGYPVYELCFTKVYPYKTRTKVFPLD